MGAAARLRRAADLLEAADCDEELAEAGVLAAEVAESFAA